MNKKLNDNGGGHFESLEPEPYRNHGSDLEPEPEPSI